MRGSHSRACWGCRPRTFGLKPVRAPASVGPVDRDAAIMPPLLAVSGMAFEQQSMRLHDPVDALHVHRRAAFAHAADAAAMHEWALR